MIASSDAARVNAHFPHFMLGGFGDKAAAFVCLYKYWSRAMKQTLIDLLIASGMKKSSISFFLPKSI